jgi:hypothetical protein
VITLWAGLVSSWGLGEFVLVFIIGVPPIYDTYVMWLLLYRSLSILCRELDNDYNPWIKHALDKRREIFQCPMDRGVNGQ